MCTLSWTPTPRGYALFFNRDERRTRPLALPPRLHRAAQTAFLAPTDALAHGTWIGVNQFGVTVCLLNRYHDTPIDPEGAPLRVSRGHLVLSLLPLASAQAIVQQLRTRSLSEFEPFTVCAVDRALRVQIADWTGERLTLGGSDRPGILRTSSGRDQAAAERIRGAVFAEMVSRHDQITPDLLDSFHRSHRPERGPFSVCMHREEAETQSLTVIEIGDAEANVTYVGGPPCETRSAVSSRLSLATPTT